MNSNLLSKTFKVLFLFLMSSFIIDKILVYFLNKLLFKLFFLEIFILDKLLFITYVFGL